MRDKTRLFVNLRLALGFLLFLGGCLLLPACFKDRVTESYKIYSPVYTLKSTVRAAINGDPSLSITKTGQIYVKGNYIYLNDVEKGIHVIDNHDPAHPVQTAFLNIPGNENIAIRGNILYADMYTDLLSIDITNPHQVKIIGTLWNFFTSRQFGTDNNYVITSWTSKDTSFLTGNPASRGLFIVPGTVFYANDLLTASAASNALSTGTAGSEATMTLVGNYLYAIPEQHSLGIVNITDSSQPTLVSSSFAGDDLETIFPIQNRLLLGSKEGVYIYSIDNPANPVQLSEFSHGTACDPVIADQGYAYVTLHSGTYCGGAANELDVLTAPDITQASFLKSYAMTGPSGLAKDGSLLFVCDGSKVKVFNASDPGNLQQLTELDVMNATDLIAQNNVLIVVSTGGLYQFDYSDPNHIVLLSSFLINSGS